MQDTMRPILVIGGGPGGLEAARTVAALGHPVVLVERRQRLGGTPDAERYAKLTHHFRDAEEAIGELVASVTENPLVEILTRSEVTGCEGEPGHFRVTLTTPSGAQERVFGAIIVATGFQHFDPGRETQLYNYYSFPDVVTLSDMEAMLKAHQVVRPSNGQPPERVAFIQCVGSRDRQIGNEFCSKVCCGIASKQAIEIKQQLPDARVFIFYIDMRMYGYWENELYWPAQEQYKVNYVKGIVSEILPKGDRLLIRGEDTTMGRPMEVTVDLVVLSVGMEPSSGTRQMAKLLGLAQNKYGYIEAGGPTGLDPVATSRPGIFVVGAAARPADLDDTFATAGLAAARAIATVRQAAVVR
ncbi:FAD-dependent oxidoreductase [Thermomicrobium sp. 4228-Ro]|uniref:CoB--CoM heterodisulfide reductase iron-sulfur subunit A family protein n=1 Tax=Thermomicrobium sp. 4228-Ro TaxID=2993937 RepID=UPI0022490E85|nr:FAD-dependent oxidoreductase [Thermomicrobium sp. 4228-Ro]MCX2726775.1 FAD-dependent oxidoreductase [Thermomicrobium sp. 4228-Ro]